MTVRRLALHLVAAVAAPVALGALAACSTTPDRFQGISLTADDMDEELRGLAGRAAAGDKRAQLALGIRFETGDGVPLDPGRAERLYRMAAATTHVRDVYFPSVFMKTPGKLVRRYERPRYGLPEAQERLDALRERRRAERAARREPRGG